MITSKTYLIYGLAVLMAAGYAEFRGWSLAAVTQIKNVPNSIRNNPGSYRSVYSGYHHYTGGK